LNCHLPKPLVAGSCRVLLLGLVVWLAFVSGAEAAEPPRSFHIEAGSAAQTLKQFALQAQSEIVFSAELVADVRTNAIGGELVPKAALEQMLAGTGLLATQDRTGAFAVRRMPPPAEHSPAEPRPPVNGPASEIVTLSPFLVPAESVGKYTATEATSGTRVRVSLMNAPQSVSVVTRDLMDDIGAMRVLDAAKYVAGISESTIPNAQDRTNVRGFQTDGSTIDRFNFFSFSNVDPVIVDRLEVVKGPNAILSPQIVQGTINLVTKKPLFVDRGSVAAQIGRYNANRVELDLNRVVQPNRLAVRVVAAAQRSHDQAEGNFNHSQIAMPMATYAFGETAAVTVQAQFYNAYTAAYGGLPLDLYVGTADQPRLLSGVPRNTDLYTTMAARHSVGQHYRLFFTADPTEHLSLRLAANAIQWRGSNVGISLGNPLNASGAQELLVQLDPQTGAWRWTGSTNDDPVFPRSGSFGVQERAYWNLQHDLAYRRSVGPLRTTTLAGYMVDYLKNPGYGVGFTMPPLAIRSFAPAPYTRTALNGDAIVYTWDEQVYLNEVLELAGDRVTLNGGVARAWYKTYVNDHFRGRTAQNTPDAVLPTASIVVKPIPQLALYAGMSRQSTALVPSTTATIPNQLQTGRQYEFGARAQSADRRIFATATAFTISQSNFAVPNPANAVVPAPVPPYPPLFSDLRIRGVEFELHAALTPNWSIVGSASAMHARNPVGQPFRGIAERTAALWTSYTFDRGSALRPLSFGLGVDYLGRRAGDFPSGTPTTASTPAHLILPQPSFWLPPRTLINLAVTYRWNDRWKLQLNVDNVLDQQYLAASTGRNTVFPGTPINPRFTVTHSW
jgi:iron complex outermembrane receptor protein